MFEPEVGSLGQIPCGGIAEHIICIVAILAEGDVKGEVAGALASESVLNLEAAKAEPEIEIFKFTELKDLPAGALQSVGRGEKQGVSPVFQRQGSLALERSLDGDVAGIVATEEHMRQTLPMWAMPPCMCA